MNFIETKLSGCFVIEPDVFKDERGYFYESYHKERFDLGVGQEVNFVQDNQSFSSYGVLRGLHFQRGHKAQAKLVRVLSGSVLDVVVDLRKGSTSFGQHIAIQLNNTNMRQLFIPRGFAHGFVVLSEKATFSYKCDNYYDKASEGGIIFNDGDLKIDWRLPINDIEVSEKDRNLLPLNKFSEINQY